MELHFLPGHAPGLNPDEFVWSNLRSKGTSKKPFKNKESLRKRADQDLSSIKKDKALVRSLSRLWHHKTRATGRTGVWHEKKQTITSNIGTGRAQGFRAAGGRSFSPCYPICLA